MMDLEHLLPARAAPLAGAAAPAGEAPALLPPQPKSVRDTGLEQQLVVELLAKLLLVDGRTALPVLTGKLRLSLNVLREVFAFMIAEQLAEVAWRGASDIDVQYQLTGAGKQRAALYLERCPYVGAAPVPLEAYRAQVLRQAWRQPQRERVGAAEVAAVYGADLLEAGLLEQLGAAVHAGRSLLLYGPSGGGKSHLAGKLGQLMPGLVAVPYAVLVGQEIVVLHDSAIHLPPGPRQAVLVQQALERRSSDTRWLLCQRPVVQAGAELEAGMLELRHDAYGGCYRAPPQWKANNGIFIVDDLGRQRLPAADLLNRFLPALEQGADQLALRGGHSLSVPFDALLVCATNLAPRALLDAGALRRLGYKIAVPALAPAAYRALLRQQCQLLDVACDEAGVRHLLEQLHAASGQPLLAAYPGELVGRVVDFAAYAGQPPQLSVAALEQAWASMFAGEAGALPAAAAAVAGSGATTAVAAAPARAAFLRGEARP